MNAPPGSSEFLSSLLTGPNHSCPHENKKKNEELPFRLGFFRATDGTMTYIDTNKLCQQCYELAVPKGFNVWSTYYKFSEMPMSQELQERFRNAMMDSAEWGKYYGRSKTKERKPPVGWAALRLTFNDDFYPPMWQAGTEDDPDAEVRRERMPSNAEAHEAFRYLQFLGDPFYIDQLHLTRKWDPNAEDREAEDRRVAIENNLAYQRAAHGLVGTGVGGAGPFSIVEQRILGDRAIQIPGRFGGNDDDTTSQQLNETYPRQGLPPEADVQEVPPNFPERYWMPSLETIDKEEYKMTGRVTGPTPDEIKRRSSLELESARFNLRGGSSHPSAAENVAAKSPTAKGRQALP
ncbi:hypothetical protein F5B19DRAFT_461899 [Rostrohypoxylon terebratum]|nr:hypothetical protein F5B19DRAFT_461899 [Rostrohypoxylon terebratum]